LNFFFFSKKRFIVSSSDSSSPASPLNSGLVVSIEFDDVVDLNDIDNENDV